MAPNATGPAAAPTLYPPPGHVERLITRVEARYSRRVAAVDADAPNPRAPESLPGLSRLLLRADDIAAEWHAFRGAGGRLPLFEDLLGERQDNVDSWWRAGPIIAERQPIHPLADHFTGTVRALQGIPALRSTIWSVMGPGARLPEHQATNAAALRLLIGVDAQGAELTIEGRPVSLRNGTAVLFDDTKPHESWNESSSPRVILMCNIARPLPGVDRWMSMAVLVARHRLTPRFHQGVARAGELHRSLNPELAPPARQASEPLEAAQRGSSQRAR